MFRFPFKMEQRKKITNKFIAAHLIEFTVLQCPAHCKNVMVQASAKIYSILFLFFPMQIVLTLSVPKSCGDQIWDVAGGRVVMVELVSGVHRMSFRAWRKGSNKSSN